MQEKRYIIRLNREFTDACGNALYSARGANTLVFDKYGIDKILEPADKYIDEAAKTARIVGAASCFEEIQDWLQELPLDEFQKIIRESKDFIDARERFIEAERKAASKELAVLGLGALAAGDSFVFGGIDWVCLDPEYKEPAPDGTIETGVLAITKEIWANDVKFSVGGEANYITSIVRKKLLDELLPVLGADNLIAHNVDLTADDGGNRLGSVKSKVFILTDAEYRAYREYIPHYGFWWWTATPWSSSPSYAGVERGVNALGALTTSNAIYGEAVAAACIFRKSE